MTMIRCILLVIVSVSVSVPVSVSLVSTVDVYHEECDTY
jgi:hypothetical protein